MNQTIQFSHPPSIVGHAAVVGKKEGDGPLSHSFDLISPDDKLGESTWEKSEIAFQKQALSLALDKAGASASTLDYLLGGDLLNQCIATSFAARGQNVPFLGLYAACATLGAGLSLGGMLLDGGFGNLVGVTVSSHFCTAERQYRTPLEYGGQRTPTAQWTVTGAGAFVLSSEGDAPPYLTHCTLGKIIDKGVTDVNNMGAAMAPANVNLGKCPKIPENQRNRWFSGLSSRQYDLSATAPHRTVRAVFPHTALQVVFGLSLNSRCSWSVEVLG